MAQVTFMTLLSEPPRIGGTLVWYYAICRREVWLMSHGIEPDREDEFLRMGRLIDQNSYGHQRHAIEFGNNKFDIIREEKGTLVVGEVKKSSRSLEAAKLQLAHYLYELLKNGINARGELLFPKEKRRETIDLTDEMKKRLDEVYGDIRSIALESAPPPAKKCAYCRSCAYKDFCWS